MDFSTIDPVLMIASLIVAAVPLIFAGIGELIVEKSGVLNLGVEGMMIIGAALGFIAAVETGSPWLGFLAAACAGAALSLIFILLTQYLNANQVATGLALTLFGLGLAALLGQNYTGMKPPSFSAIDIEGLSDLPILGKLVFSYDPMVYGAFALVVLISLFLHFTRMGLLLRAVGENHHSAHALGHKVRLIRVWAILFGGACAGLGGACISLLRVPQWAEGMTAGTGWIALALVVFASWKPYRLLIGALLFGGVNVIQLNLQAAGISIQSQYLSMAPYLITILVLVFISSHKVNAPGSLGRKFNLEH